MENKKSNFVKDALLLCIITVVAGAALAFVNAWTAPIIEEQKAAASAAAFKAVYADASKFEESKDLTAYITSDEFKADLADAGVEGGNVSAALEAKDASGNVVGYVMTISGKGFGGDVVLSVGVAKDGNFTGYEIMEISETPGLGMRAKDDPSFLTQYVGKAGLFTLGGGIDAMAGATVTSKACNNAMNAAAVVVGKFGGAGLNAAVEVVEEPKPTTDEVCNESVYADAASFNADDALVQYAASNTEAKFDEAFDALDGSGAVIGYVLKTTVQGFGGDITMLIGVSKDGNVVGYGFLTINETPGLGMRALEDPSFCDQFIGKGGSFELGSGIDGMSGATITSTAVTHAMNAAVTVASGFGG